MNKKAGTIEKGVRYWTPFFYAPPLGLEPRTY